MSDLTEVRWPPQVGDAVVVIATGQILTVKSTPDTSVSALDPRGRFFGLSKEAYTAGELVYIPLEELKPVPAGLAQKLSAMDTLHAVLSGWTEQPPVGRASETAPDAAGKLDGATLTVTLTPEQARRLLAIQQASEFTLSVQIGAMVDLDFEEYQDALEVVNIAAPRSTLWARFVRSGLDR